MRVISPSISAARLRARSGPFVVARTLTAWAMLVWIVATSAVLRTLTASPQPIPRLLPDEYIYASLARSLADGNLAIRGQPADFPALLEPLLAAPFSLVGDLELAFRLTLGMHAVAMSLAAVPVYLLARRLRLPTWQALAAAAFSVSVPAMLYTSYWTAEAIAYPLALAAVAAGVAALERPSGRLQAAFLGFAALATFARVQYAVLVPAFVAAALLLAGRRPLEAVRRYGLTFALLGGATVLVLAAGAGRVLGYYESILDLGIDVDGLAEWAALDLALLAYASGLVLVPAAVAGLAAGLRAGAAQTERAFAALALFLGLALLAEATLYATNGSDRFQERYLMTLTPLLLVAAFVGWRRLPAGRLLMAATAAVLFVVSVRLPVSEHTAADLKQDSPFLLGVSRLETAIGSGSSALVVAAVAAIMLLLAVGAAWRPKVGPAVAVAAALAVSLSGSWAATDYDAALDESARASLYAEGDPSWVDRSGLDGTAILVPPGTGRALVSTHLFWNESLRRVLVLPGGTPPDAYGSDAVRILRDGRLHVGGQPVRSPLLVVESQAQVGLSAARLVGRTSTASLWQPTGVPRLSMLVAGRYADGRLAWPEATVRVWPGAEVSSSGVLCLTLSNPEPAATTLTLSTPSSQLALRLPAQARRAVALRVGASSPWTLTIRGRDAVSSNGRLVFAELAPPRLLSPSIGPQGGRPHCR